jgi:pyrimidine-nucleoside phosphorylase
MMFIPAQIIKKKRDGLALSKDEIDFMVSRYYKEDLPDYQMAALLMAIVLKGMTKQEAADLTLSMLHSGEALAFKDTKFLPVDKHSTGGIGDKTSLLIAPIVAACGVPVPMIAGRGLGHTGGTLDKLESIPGFNVFLSLKKFQEQVLNIGCAIIGQTAEICPADKKMYALRDVTGTVESVPLICGSILSKKIAEGIRGLVMDVKWGTGAFMKTPEQAEELALWLAETAEKSGLKTTAFITDMNQPLGRFVGNAIEVLECIALFKNEPVLGFSPSDFQDTLDLSLHLSAEMLVLSGHSPTFDAALKVCQTTISNGSAYKKFQEMCAAQGGALDSFQFPNNLAWTDVVATRDGFVESFDGEALGYGAIALGAGRKQTADPIDHFASIIVRKKSGAAVKKGDAVLSFTCKDASRRESAEAILKTAYKVADQEPRRFDLIFKRISVQ